MTIKNKKYIYLTEWCNETDTKIMKFYNELIESICKDFPNEPPTAVLHQYDSMKCVCIRQDHYNKCCIKNK